MNVTEKYRHARDGMISKFIDKYWVDDEGEYAFRYLIGDNFGQHGGPLAINDEYFFSMEEVYEALQNNFDLDKILEYKELEVETEGYVGVNFYNFCKYGLTPSPTKEEIERSKKRLEHAKKLFEEEVLRHNKLEGK